MPDDGSLISGVLTTLAVGLLSVWLLLTVIVQVPKARTWIRRRDPFIIVPEWRFFAPQPAQGDYHLLYRDIFSDGTVGPWQEEFTLGPRKVSQALWHPGKRDRKALFDIVTQLQEYRRLKIDSVEVSTPYLMLLNHVSQVPRLVRPQATQFMIMQSFGWFSETPVLPLFISGRHRIGSESEVNPKAPSDSRSGMP